MNIVKKNILEQGVSGVATVVTTRVMTEKERLIDIKNTINLTQNQKNQKANEKEKNAILKADLEWSNTVYFAGFVASFVMFFFIQAFQIPSESMYNTLIKKDHLFVNKAAYGFRIPFTNIRFGEFNKIKQGDIIVFQFPAKDRKQQNCGGSQYGKDFVKRVIAMPGDTVQIIDGRPWVNGQKLPQQDYDPGISLRS